MNAQPEALRLADLLERPGYGYHTTPAQCATELRRLHEVNQELLEALKDMVENFCWGDMNSGEHEAIESARAAIAKAGSQQ